MVATRSVDESKTCVAVHAVHSHSTHHMVLHLVGVGHGDEQDITDHEGKGDVFLLLTPFLFADFSAVSL